MKYVVKSVIMPLIIMCITLSCVSKKQWQGRYITVSYTSIAPKEDFKASGYIVVAYDIVSQDKHSHVLYRFDIMLDNEKMGTLEICDSSIDMYGFATAEGYEYYLIAGDIESSEGRPSSLSISWVTHKVHQMYKSKPDYDIAKNDVINVLMSM